MTNTTKTFKKDTLRYNEYYDMQSCFDDLYAKSKQQQNFKHLYEKVIDENNIRLAYRNIKSNTGSNTQGTDGLTVKDYSNLTDLEVVRIVRNNLNNYKPDLVKRVEIPKPNGKKRPLGIPTFKDRLIQQCLKQILEPICEAKFYNHSYGFRPNRSTEHALSRMGFLMNKGSFHYCVDIDIKGFFDNINHGKLLKQLWSMGIRDKKIISIISKMLKAEIKGVGKPTKGTPQGGILSPLLANVVLNEFDWWISSQWENQPIQRCANDRNRYRELRKGRLKEVFIVRYADDFKLMCKDYKTAEKIYIASKKWLEERLGLEVSDDKSKITNLKKKYSEFLGYKLKVTRKGKKDKNGKKKVAYVLESHVCDKALETMRRKILKRIKDLQVDQSKGNVALYNSSILGMHNYYKHATNVVKDFAKLDYLLRKPLYNRLRKNRQKSSIDKINSTVYKYYNGFKGKVYSMAGIVMYPISYVQNDHPLGFSQEKCDYTKGCRELLHKDLDIYIKSNILYMLRNPIRNATIEFNDNRISKYSSQKGKCAVTGEFMTHVDMDCHHKRPRFLGGSDKYDNLFCVKRDVHRLIHATNTKTIDYYLGLIRPNKDSLTKINKFRTAVGNEVIKLTI